VILITPTFRKFFYPIVPGNMVAKLVRSIRHIILALVDWPVRGCAQTRIEPCITLSPNVHYVVDLAEIINAGGLCWGLMSFADQVDQWITYRGSVASGSRKPQPPPPSPHVLHLCVRKLGLFWLGGHVPSESDMNAAARKTRQRESARL